MKRRYIITLLVIAITCIFLIGCNDVTEFENYEVNGIVTSKEYHDAYSVYAYEYIDHYFSLLPINHPNEYNVTIKYGNISATFNNEELFNSVSEGDIIPMVLVKGYTNNHKLITQEILPKAYF